MVPDTDSISGNHLCQLGA